MLCMFSPNFNEALKKSLVYYYGTKINSHKRKLTIKGNYITFSV